MINTDELLRVIIRVNKLRRHFLQDSGQMVFEGHPPRPVWNQVLQCISRNRASRRYLPNFSVKGDTMSVCILSPLGKCLRQWIWPLNCTRQTFWRRASRTRMHGRGQSKKFIRVRRQPLPLEKYLRHHAKRLTRSFLNVGIDALGRGVRPPENKPFKIMAD